MKLIHPNDWAAKYFAPESRPGKVKLNKMCREGKLPARKVGGTWYINENEWLADGDPLVLSVLEDAA